MPLFRSLHDKINPGGIVKRVLVLCTGNSCRSQMAEGWLRFFGDGKFLVHSAGVEAHGLHPRAVAVMAEAGVDISSHTSKTVDTVKDLDFDVVITVCDNARERCPYFPAKSLKLHQDFPDPAKVEGSDEEIMEAFRSVRDQLKHYCHAFVIHHMH